MQQPNLQELRILTDRVDTKYGDDDVVAALVSSIDDLIEAIENGEKVIHRQTVNGRYTGPTGGSGYRHVSWSKKARKWMARIRRWEEVNGERKLASYYLGYYNDPVLASAAAEEKRRELGMPV